MKMLLIDDRQNSKIVGISPLDEFKTTDYFVPCSECGTAVLQEHATNGICHQCLLHSMDEILNMGWQYEHPGYFQKNFGDKITVVAGTSEYRFDFTFCGADHDLGWGPDWCIDVEDWNAAQTELKDRGCFTAGEHEELWLVYEYLHAHMKRSKADTTPWAWDAGGLSCPNGIRYDNEEYETEPFHITKEMIFGVAVGELTTQQHARFAELQNIILTWLVEESK
jgi:hypothetical protein